MADLDETKQSEVTRITNGDETNIAEVSSLSELTTVDYINGAGTQAGLTVGTSAIEVKAGGSRFVNRKSVTIYNNSGKLIYWGFSGVTTSSGTPIDKAEFVILKAGDQLGIFVISADTGLDIRITESY